MSKRSLIDGVLLLVGLGIVVLITVLTGGFK
jgi:hypothetical protein